MTNISDTAMTTLSAPPTGLMCELMENPGEALICVRKPRFGWIVPVEPHFRPVAYQIIVASSLENLFNDTGDMWDSGEPLASPAWTANNESVGIEYAGLALESRSSYFWKVRLWSDVRTRTAWSEPAKFSTGDLTDSHTTSARPLDIIDSHPVSVISHNGKIFIDFGKDAFGKLRLTLTSPDDNISVGIKLGEVLDGRYSILDTKGNSRRYAETTVVLKKGRHTYNIELPADKRNTSGAAVRLPESFGVIFPFRYCELTGLPSPLTRDDIIRRTVFHPFNDSASDFISSDTTLNAVWDLCKYSMKATSFCGLYVDGDRERIPYEADAYINQLSHYACDREYTMARRTHEYLIEQPTWPTEWIFHSILMAWEDYMQTGDDRSLRAFYPDLKKKLMLPLFREDGLFVVPDDVPAEIYHDIHLKGKLKNIVDWPPVERDGYDMVPANTVVNAFAYKALVLMSKIADVVVKPDDAADFKSRAAKLKAAAALAFYDPERGIFVDGEGSTHSSLHANAFPIALGLWEPTLTMTDFLQAKGMACSVYGAQYLLEALYLAGQDEMALSMMMSVSERSWYNMIRVGSTITTEAWDMRFKQNQDWNHAWGAAPANIISRYVLGVRPLAPGFSKVIIQPRLVGLSFVSATVPTIRGPIRIQYALKDGGGHMEVDIPGNMDVTVSLPWRFGSDVLLDGKSIHAPYINGHPIIPTLSPGRHTMMMR
ncbi:MAG: alpha-L-rhamnosidase C-terminal domain-containing protein [Planctomycetota bacterium]